MHARKIGCALEFLAAPVRPMLIYSGLIYWKIRAKKYLKAVYSLPFTLLKFQLVTKSSIAWEFLVFPNFKNKQMSFLN